MSEEVKEHKIKTRNLNGVIQDILFLPNSHEELQEVCVFIEKCSCTPDHPHFCLIYHDNETEVQLRTWEEEDSSKEAMRRLREQVVKSPFMFDARRIPLLY